MHSPHHYGRESACGLPLGLGRSFALRVGDTLVTGTTGLALVGLVGLTLGLGLFAELVGQGHGIGTLGHFGIGSRVEQSGLGTRGQGEIDPTDDHAIVPAFRTVQELVTLVEEVHFGRGTGEHDGIHRALAQPDKDRFGTTQTGQTDTRATIAGVGNGIEHFGYDTHKKRIEW
jgi:hypothetical protein